MDQATAAEEGSHTGERSGFVSAALCRRASHRAALALYLARVELSRGPNPSAEVGIAPFLGPLPFVFLCPISITRHQPSPFPSLHPSYSPPLPPSSLRALPPSLPLSLPFTPPPPNLPSLPPTASLLACLLITFLAHPIPSQPSQPPHIRPTPNCPHHFHLIPNLPNHPSI
jgi:hypothetical protein